MDKRREFVEVPIKQNEGDKPKYQQANYRSRKTE
jgi:hypothetical protein